MNCALHPGDTRAARRIAITAHLAQPLPASETTLKRRLQVNLNRLRVAHGFTQAQLADAIDVKRSTVGAWSEGRAAPRLGKLIELSRLFGVTIEQLLSSR